jgi:hypothetical protein
MRKSGFDLRKFDKFRKQINRACNSSGGSQLDGVFKQWGVRYLAWTKRLFLKNSAGGGDWPALKASTIASRRAGRTRKHRERGRGYRKRGPTGKVSILRDTGTLFKALTIGAAGNLFKFIKGGVRVGFGGPAKHPEGKATIRDIAVFHDQGKGNLQKRQILHKPDDAFKRAMLKDLKRGIERIGKNL